LVVFIIVSMMHGYTNIRSKRDDCIRFFSVYRTIKIRSICLLLSIGHRIRRSGPAVYCIYCKKLLVK